MKKTKEQIIHDMCMSYRHDYGLRIEPEDAERWPVSSGMTHAEARHLYEQMRQIFENSIEPYVILKDE